MLKFYFDVSLLYLFFLVALILFDFLFFQVWLKASVLN